MGACVAYNCTNRCSKKVPGITFHSFPKNEALCKQWILAVRRVNWRPTKCSKLCSQHFSENVIDRTSLSCVRLRENAVPTIFNFPAHLQKISKPRKPPSRKSLVPSVSSHTIVEAEVSSGEIVDEHKSPTKATYKTKVAELNTVVESKDKKIKVLQQKLRRYQKKMKDLSDLVMHLKEKHFLDDGAACCFM